MAYKAVEDGNKKLHSFEMNGKVNDKPFGSILISSLSDPKKSYKKTFLNSLKVVHQNNPIMTRKFECLKFLDFNVLISPGLRRFMWISLFFKIYLNHVVNNDF